MGVVMLVTIYTGCELVGFLIVITANIMLTNSSTVNIVKYVISPLYSLSFSSSVLLIFGPINVGAKIVALILVEPFDSVIVVCAFVGLYMFWCPLTIV